jgi:hypothetical protein
MSNTAKRATSRVIDKRMARKLIQELQVRAGWRVQRLSAPSRPTRYLPPSLQARTVDAGASVERVMSPQAVALAKRQLNRRERNRPSPKRLSSEAALEAYPRIVGRLCQLWGFREIRPYLESLVLVEASRIERQGLDPRAQEELMFLYGLTEDYSRLLFAPEERSPALELSALYHFAR